MLKEYKGIKMLAKYEVEVCRFCRQCPCEYNDLVECQDNYERRGYKYETRDIQL